MKSLKLIGLAVVAAFICPALSSCSDDDDDKDDNGGNGGSNATDVFDGKQLTSVGDISFSYDDKGRCTGISEYGTPELSINYSKGTIQFYNNDYAGGNIKIKFNGKGYITEISGTISGSEDGNTYKASGKYTFSYSNGCLTGVHSVSKESGVDEGEKYNYSDDYKETYKWTNGNLVETSCKYTENEDGEKFSGSSRSYISYGSEVNKFRQYSLALAEALFDGIDDDYCESLSLVGMFGSASVNFPTAVEQSWNDSDGDSGETSYTCSFTLNADETVASETNSRSSYRTYYYSYGTPRTVVSSDSEKILDFSKLLRRRTHSKHFGR